VWVLFCFFFNFSGSLRKNVRASARGRVFA
jgi:hypothetical protein